MIPTPDSRPNEKRQHSGPRPIVAIEIGVDSDDLELLLGAAVLSLAKIPAPEPWKTSIRGVLSALTRVISILDSKGLIVTANVIQKADNLIKDVEGSEEFKQGMAEAAKVIDQVNKAKSEAANKTINGTNN